jgi:hypothetical protein
VASEGLRQGERRIWVAIRAYAVAVTLESSLVSCAKNCEQQSRACPADIDAKIRFRPLGRFYCVGLRSACSLQNADTSEAGSE